MKLGKTPLSSRVTVPARFVRPLIDELSARGVALDEALSCPGGPLSEPSLWNDGELDRDDFVHAFGVCTVLLEQAICSPRAKSGSRRKAFELFFDFMVAAGNLREVCERAAQFNAMMEERGYTLGLVVDDEIARFTIDFKPSIATAPAALIVAAMVFFHNLFSWLTATPLGLSRIGLASKRPRAIDPNLDVLCADVGYCQTQNYIAFDAAALDRKVVRSAEDFAGIADYIGYDPMFVTRLATATADRIRTMLLDETARCGRMPDSLAAAALLGVSISTLSRRLRREHTSYLKVKADCQRDLGKQLLRRGTLTMSEIAAQLGFVDARSFRRAFVVWEGVLPSFFQAGATGS